MKQHNSVSYGLPSLSPLTLILQEISQFFSNIPGLFFQPMGKTFTNNYYPPKDPMKKFRTNDYGLKLTCQQINSGDLTKLTKYCCHFPLVSLNFTDGAVHCQSHAFHL